MIFIDPNALVCINVVGKKQNFEYKFSKVKNGKIIFAHYIGGSTYGYYPSKEELEDKFIVEDNKVYYRPKVYLELLGNHSHSFEFKSYEEAVDFANRQKAHMDANIVVE